MDPVSIVIAALAAGALTGVGETATKAIADAYAGLKGLVQARFAGRPAAQVVLEEHEKAPEDYERPLRRELEATNAAQDPAVLDSARRLLELVDAEGSRAGKYHVELHGNQGVYVGDHGAQLNVFGTDRPAKDPPA